jgi:hypothetical protein
MGNYQIYYLSSLCPDNYIVCSASGNWQPVPGANGVAQAGPKVTQNFTFPKIQTNAVAIVITSDPGNLASPYELYELEVMGKSFSVLYAGTYHVDFTWSKKNLGQERNELKHLDYWIEDIKESLPSDFIQTSGKSYSTKTSSYNIITKQVNLLRMYQYNDDETFNDKKVGRLFYGTPLAWENQEFRVGETKKFGNYKVKLVDINWDKSQTTVNFDHKIGTDFLGEKKVTVEITDPQGVVKRHIMTIECCQNVLAELFVDTQAESQAATEALCKLVTTGNNCDIIPIVYHSRMNEAGIDSNYIYNYDYNVWPPLATPSDASLHFGPGNTGWGPSYHYTYGYGYDFNAALNYPTLIFNGNKSKAIQRVPPDTVDSYYDAYLEAYENNASKCCDAKVVINTNFDPERLTTLKDKEALVSVRLNKALPNAEVYLNIWGINCDCCAPVASKLIKSEYWQNKNKWNNDPCGGKESDYNWKDLKSGDVYSTEIELCGTNYCGIVAFIQDKNTGKVYGSGMRLFGDATSSSNLSPEIASSQCQCLIEYDKDLDCDNYEEEVEFAIEGADVAFVGMEHDLEKNIDGEIKKHMIARFNVYTLIDYGCIDDCDCGYITNDGSLWKLNFVMNDQNVYNPWNYRCTSCSKDLRSIKIELCEPIPFDCLKEGAVFWGPDRYFRVYVEDYDEEKYYVKYKIQRIDLVPKKETVNVKVEPTNLIRTDKQITAQDRVKYNMILIGNKDNNEEIKRVYEIGNFTDSEGMIYLKDIYGQKDILILNATNISDLNEPIKQLSYLLDMIL